MKRRDFVRTLAVTTAGLPLLKLVPAAKGAVAAGFTFARARYGSGNWDADPKMPSNILNSLVEYTSLRVDPEEVVIDLDSEEIFTFPFLYLTGNKLVRFTKKERENFGRYISDGGFMFVDDCNHDIDGVFAKTFEREVETVFPGSKGLHKLPNNHQIYHSFFEFPDGPPNTSHELNGWGDDIVHDYLKAVEVRGRVGLLYSNKDYGCEWNYDFTNKRFSSVDNTRFGVNIITYALTH